MCPLCPLLKCLDKICAGQISNTRFPESCLPNLSSPSFLQNSQRFILVTFPMEEILRRISKILWLRDGWSHGWLCGDRGRTFLRFIKFHKTVDCQPAQLCTPRLPPGWLALCIQCTNTCYHLGMSLSIFSDLGLDFYNIAILFLYTSSTSESAAYHVQSTGLRPIKTDDWPFAKIRVC